MGIPHTALPSAPSAAFSPFKTSVFLREEPGRIEEFCYNQGQKDQRRGDEADEACRPNGGGETDGGNGRTWTSEAERWNRTATDVHRTGWTGAVQSCSTGSKRQGRLKFGDWSKQIHRLESWNLQYPKSRKEGSHLHASTLWFIGIYPLHLVETKPSHSTHRLSHFSATEGRDGFCQPHAEPAPSLQCEDQAAHLVLHLPAARLVAGPGGIYTTPGLAAISQQPCSADAREGIKQIILYK